MTSENSLILSTVNELINLIILTSAQLTTQSLKEAKLSIHIFDQNLDSQRGLNDDALYCRISWNRVNCIDDIIDIFANTITIQKQWVELYKKCEISHEPCFVFTSSYSPNSQTIRKLIISDKGVKMLESHENIDTNENLFKIFTPPFETDPINSTQIFNSLKEILQTHSIINPRLTTSIKFTSSGSIKGKWTHERLLCPFNYYQLGKYFANDLNYFKKCNVPNVNSYLVPPNYRRLAKPQNFCVQTCKNCRWKLYFLACVSPPLKSRSKLCGDQILDVNVVLVGPNNTLLFPRETTPVLSAKTWAKWGKFDVKLSNNSNSPFINSLYYVNNLEGKAAENSLILLIGFDLDSSGQDFKRKAESLHFLTSNFTQIIEANESFIQSSCETLLSKLIRNQSDVKTKQNDAFLLNELCNAINSIINRSTNPEVKADYLNALQANDLDKSHDILHQQLISNFEEHLKQFEPINTNDKRANQFTPTPAKRQITDQSFEDLEHYNEEEDYNYLQEVNTELPLIPDGNSNYQFSPFPKTTNISTIESEDSNSLLKSPLFDISSLPPTPQKLEKHSQSSGNTEFNALADELSSPRITPHGTTNRDFMSPECLTIPANIDTLNTPLPYFEDKINSQISANSSQDFKLLSNENLLFSPSITQIQSNDSHRGYECSQDYEELAREM